MNNDLYRQHLNLILCDRVEIAYNFASSGRGRRRLLLLGHRCWMIKIHISVHCRHIDLFFLLFLERNGRRYICSGNFLLVQKSLVHLLGLKVDLIGVVLVTRRIVKSHSFKCARIMNILATTTKTIQIRWQTHIGTLIV